MTELARAEQVSPPTISRLVRDLEGAGLVRIIADPNDGRVRRVEATDSGRKLLDEGRRRRVGALAEDLAGLSQRDRRTLARAAGILATLVRPRTPPGDGRTNGSVESINRSRDPDSAAPPAPDR
jgi:DNA-binding MarR family transcriptional regulator